MLVNDIVCKLVFLTRPADVWLQWSCMYKYAPSLLAGKRLHCLSCPLLLLLLLFVCCLYHQMNYNNKAMLVGAMLVAGYDKHLGGQVGLGEGRGDAATPAQHSHQNYGNVHFTTPEHSTALYMCTRSMPRSHCPYAGCEVQGGNIVN